MKAIKNLNLLILFLLFNNIFLYSNSGEVKFENNTKDLTLRINPEAGSAKPKYVAPGNTISFDLRNILVAAPNIKPKISMHTCTKKSDVSDANFAGFYGFPQKIELTSGKVTRVVLEGDAENGITPIIYKPGSLEKVPLKKEPKRNLQEDLEDTTHRIINNTDSVVDVWTYFAHIKTAGIMVAEEIVTDVMFFGAGKAIAAAAKTTAGKVIKKAGSNLLVKTGIKKAAKETLEEGIEAGAKKVVKEGTEEVIETTVEKAATKTASKDVAKEAVEETGEDIVAKTFKFNEVSKSIGDLKTTLNDLEVQKTTLGKQLDELNTQNKNLTDKLNLAKNENIELKPKIDQLNIESKNLKSKIDEIEKNIQPLKKQLDESNTIKKNLTDKLNLAKNEKDELTTKIDNLKEDSLDLQSNLDKLSKEKLNLNKQLDDLNIQKTEFDKVNKGQSQVVELKNEKAVLEKTTKDLDEINTLKKEIAKQENDIKDLSKIANTEEKTTLTHFKNQLDTAQVKLKNTQDKLNKKIASLSDDNLKNLNTKLSNIDTAITKNKNLKSELDKLETFKENIKQQEFWVKLWTRLQDMPEKLTTAQTNLKNAQDVLKNKIKSLGDNATIDKNSLTKELDNLTTQKNSITKELDTAIEQAKTKNKTLLDENSKKLSSIDNTNTKNLDESYKKINDALEQNKKSLEENSKNIDLTKSSLNKNSEELKTIQATLDKNTIDIDNIQGTINRKTQDINNIQNKIDSYSKELNTNKTAFETKTKETNDIQNKINNYSEEINSIQTSLGKNTQDISDIKNKIENNSKDITVTQTNLETTNKEYNELIPNIVSPKKAPEQTPTNITTTQTAKAQTSSGNKEGVATAVVGSGGAKMTKDNTNTQEQDDEAIITARTKTASSSKEFKPEPLNLDNYESFNNYSAMPSNFLTAYGNATNGGYHLQLMPGEVYWVKGGADIHNIFVAIYAGDSAQPDAGYIHFFKEFNIYGNKKLTDKPRVSNQIDIKNKDNKPKQWTDIYIDVDKAKDKIIVSATEPYDTPEYAYYKVYGKK